MTDQSIYLVRHGETAFNADGRLRGRADPDLNAAGLGQAKSLASAFASAEPSTIVSSPLLRAVQRRRSSPKAARPSTRSTCGSMIATTDAGPVNPRRTSSRNGAFLADPPFLAVDDAFGVPDRFEIRGYTGIHGSSLACRRHASVNNGRYG